MSLTNYCHIQTNKVIYETGSYFKIVEPTMCRREDSNLHGLPHTLLKRARLPFRHFGSTLLTPVLYLVRRQNAL